jgi:hypothetical protein
VEIGAVAIGGADQCADVQDILGDAGDLVFGRGRSRDKDDCPVSRGRAAPGPGLGC